jgi:hypothetical protein
MDPVLFSEPFMKVVHVKVKVALPVQRKDLLHDLKGHAPGTGLASAPVKQPIIAPPLIAPFPAPHTATRDPQDLGSLEPVNLATSTAGIE